MKVQTKWFGEIEVSDDKIITFDKELLDLRTGRSILLCMMQRKRRIYQLYGFRRLMSQHLHFLS